MNQMTPSKIRRLSRDFGIKDVAALCGCTMDEVRAIRQADARERAQRESEKRRLLKRCPVGRDPAEHERIVEACFG